MRIKELRKARGLSQAELGRRVGVDQSRICRWESGELPLADKLPALAVAFGCRIEELYEPAELEAG